MKDKNCGCGQIDTSCGCKTKLDLLCTFYGGELLLPLNIPTGTDGNTVIKIINDYIQQVLVDFELDATVIDNVGTGAILYKGLSDTFIHEFKSLLEGSGINITEQANSITISIDEQWIADNTVINNVGTGARIWKDKVGGTNNLRTIKSTDSITASESVNEIELSIDQDWIEENAPVIGAESVGTGTPIFLGIEDKNLQIATIESDNIIITQNPDGSVKINTPGGGRNSNDYYLDVNFTRPSNWDDNAELIDGLKTATGTLNDPFKTFEEYLRRCIGETGGSNANGLYSRVNPKNPNKKLRVLSNVTTDKELEINTCSIELESAAITYTGTEEYAGSSARLFDAMPKTGGVIDREIYWEVSGEGDIVNRFHFGVIHHKTSKTATTTIKRSFLMIIAKGNGLNFYESSDSATYTPLTLADGTTPMLHGGVQVQGSTQQPTTPLIKIEGRNSIYWGAGFTGTKLFLQSSTQSFIECDNEGSLTSSLDSINYLVNSNFIGYQKKIYTGLPGITSDETELLIGRNNLFFKPYPQRKVFSSKNNSQMRLENIGTLSDVNNQLGIDSIFNMEGESIIAVPTGYNDIGGGSAISFISMTGNNNYIEFSSTCKQNSYMNFFAKGDGSNTVRIGFNNGTANGIDKIKKDISTLELYTNGTWSSIKSIPINTNIQSFANNAAAVAADYLPGMVYFNTTENAISKVN